ncbi:MAG: biopolymer transporter ExbD [Myxococcota bacterium]
MAGGMAMPQKGGKKALDLTLNLVPFIDLLITNICFLLITAVWTQLARINVSQKGQGAPSEEQQEPPPEQVKLIVLVEEDGFTLIAGGERLSVPKNGAHYDTEKLASLLREIKGRLPDKTDITVASDDGIKYESIIETMDVALMEKFPDIQLSESAAAM